MKNPLVHRMRLAAMKTLAGRGKVLEADWVVGQPLVAAVHFQVGDVKRTIGVDTREVHGKPIEYLHEMVRVRIELALEDSACA